MTLRYQLLPSDTPRGGRPSPSSRQGTDAAAPAAGTAAEPWPQQAPPTAAPGDKVPQQPQLQAWPGATAAPVHAARPHHRRCRSLGAAAHSPVSWGLHASQPTAPWLPVLLPGYEDAPGSPEQPCARPQEQLQLGHQQQQQQHNQHTHHHEQQQQQQQQLQQHPLLAPGACQQRPASRHRRSASLGWSPGQGVCRASGSPLARLGGGGGGPFGLATGGGRGGGGSFLSLSSLGGALGALVSRPSLLLEAGAAACAATPPRAPNSHPLSRAPSSGCLLPSCLICLDAVTPEDWEAGEAIHQACACKGDVSLRHLRCAVRWSLVKRSTVCDVCRRPIVNLPAPPAEAGAFPPGGEGGGGGGGEAWDALALGAELPSLRTAALDALGVATVALSVCVLFFGVPVPRVLAAGALAGVAISAAVRALAAASRSAEAVRAFAAALRERAWLQGRRRLQQQRQQLQHIQPQTGDDARDGSPRAPVLPPVAELAPGAEPTPMPGAVPTALSQLVGGGSGGGHGVGGGGSSGAASAAAAAAASPATVPGDDVWPSGGAGAGGPTRRTRSLLALGPRGAAAAAPAAAVALTIRAPAADAA